MIPVLETLLDETHDALLAGDLGRLARVCAEIDSLSGLEAPNDRATVERLRRKAECNVHLLQSASRGVKAALVRLAEITAAPSLKTYDARGRKAEISQNSEGALRRF